jgi:protoheme ferro-lyase
MRNWHPFLSDTLAAMSRDGVRRAVGFIAAAQRSYSSCTQYRENVDAARAMLHEQRLRDVEVVYVGDWHAHPGFIEANATHIVDALATLPADVRGRARVIFTAHSIPVSMAQRYPYQRQMEETADAVARRVRELRRDGKAEDSDVRLRPAATGENEVRLKPDATRDDNVRLKPDATRDNDLRLKPDGTRDNDLRLKPDATRDNDLRLKPAATRDNDLRLKPDATRDNGVRLKPDATGEGSGNEWALVYQSRSGRPEDPWLGPDVCDYLREESAKGLAAAVLSPIGFLCDHVEVLYDLDVEAAEVCRGIGLPMARAKSVNDHPRFVDAMADTVIDTIERYRRGTPLRVVSGGQAARS